MPKYMIQASYTTEGAVGLLKDGGTKRQAAIKELAKSVGARLDALYFAFGDADVYAVLDVPDAASAAAMSLTVAASGAVHIKTIALLTPREIDEAARKSPRYVPPGG